MELTLGRTPKLKRPLNPFVGSCPDCASSKKSSSSTFGRNLRGKEPDVVINFNLKQ